MTVSRAGLTGSKPLDLGNGAVCASFGETTASWLSLGTAHLAVGFVELSALPPFDEACRGPDAARRHRREMTRSEHAFLALEIDGARPNLQPDVSDAEAPRWAGPGITNPGTPRSRCGDPGTGANRARSRPPRSSAACTSRPASSTIHDRRLTRGPEPEREAPGPRRSPLTGR